MPSIRPIPEGFHVITPYLTVRDAKAAVAFYQKAFGAKEVGRITMPSGDIGHAELQVGDSMLMLAEEVPSWGNQSPTALGGSPVGLALYVPDVDVVFQKAVEAGATVIEAVKDQFYGDRAGTLSDPFGHKWHIQTHIEDVSFPEMQRRCDAMFSAKQ
jgi:PhnB protein